MRSFRFLSWLSILRASPPPQRRSANVPGPGDEHHSAPLGMDGQVAADSPLCIVVGSSHSWSIQLLQVPLILIKFKFMDFYIAFSA